MILLERSENKDARVRAVDRFYLSMKSFSVRFKCHFTDKYSFIFFQLGNVALLKKKSTWCLLDFRAPFWLLHDARDTTRTSGSFRLEHGSYASFSLPPRASITFSRVLLKEVTACISLRVVMFRTRIPWSNKIPLLALEIGNIFLPFYQEIAALLPESEETSNAMNIPSSVFLMYASLAEKPVTSVRGYSGISITKDWVLAHGSALAPILARSRLLLEFVSTLNPGVLTPFPTKESDLLIHREISLDSDSALESTRDTRLQTETTTGKLAALWQCPLLRQTLDRSFESWTFETSKDHFDRLLLPVFLLIERRSNRREDEKGHGEGALSLVRRIEEALSLLVECTVGSILTRGAVVEIVSTPFGNPLFVNSVTRGIVGNLFGTNDCLFLTDANALPGCEGGLVHVIVNRDCKVICGMVIACMSWCRGEWVDYTFAANLLPSLKRILSKQQVSLRQEGHNATQTSRICEDRGHDCGHGHDKEQCYYHDQLLRSYQNLSSGATPTSTETLERSVVVVTCGPSWGTAILIDEGTGIFVTCAHVVSRAPEMEICLTSRITACADKSQWFARARLVYKTPLNKPYDIAILRIDPDCSNPSLRAIKLAKKPARKGEQVLSVGFPFSSKNSATFSSGVVSRTVKCMLQTSCCAQNGTSGGPILRRNSHEMLGMLVCNAASSNGSMSYPRLSMAIPVTVFAGSLAEYLRTTDPGVLETLTEVDITVQRIWKLRPVLFSNM